MFLDFLEVLGYATIDQKTRTITSKIDRKKYCKIYGESFE